MCLCVLYYTVLVQKIVVLPIKGPGDIWAACFRNLLTVQCPMARLSMFGWFWYFFGQFERAAALEQWLPRVAVSYSCDTGVPSFGLISATMLFCKALPGKISVTKNPWPQNAILTCYDHRFSADISFCVTHPAQVAWSPDLPLAAWVVQGE